MTCIPINSVCNDRRVVGNVEPVGVQLLDMNGDLMDITGLSFTARLTDTITGAVVVADGSVVVDDQGAAQVSWVPGIGETDSVGVFALYILDNSSPQRRWPKESSALLLTYQAE